ncbi:MAG: NAD(P)/FAD-dependent oxidoreductase [bacterium]|nr:NAD(P)/FAD-dependent oxidoreductase [bacterium]
MKYDYDVAVIGGGPAGLMAAGQAAARGARVLLLEKNDGPGKKLLITGKGRCNITNALSEPRELVQVFGKNGRFLLSALQLFGVDDTLAFFNKRGLKTKVERGNRVFPVSDRANDVLQLLLKFLKETGVTLKANAPVISFIRDGNRITGINAHQFIKARNIILCTGGLSYPGTGSTGDGFKWAKEFGHTVIEPRPVLVPLKLKEKWVKQLQGLSLKNVSITVTQHEKKQADAFGEALFTHDGISGPIVLDLSKKVGDLLSKGTVTLAIDFKPALEYGQLDTRVQRDFLQFNNKVFKNSLDQLLPKTAIPVMIALSGIDPMKKTNLVTREERRKLVGLLKGLPVTVRSLCGFEKAVITGGGVALKEVDPKTMRSKLIENLFFTGELLDLDGPTGGYNLQVCWSTAFAAAQAVKA